MIMSDINRIRGFIREAIRDFAGSDSEWCMEANIFPTYTSPEGDCLCQALP